MARNDRASRGLTTRIRTMKQAVKIGAIVGFALGCLVFLGYVMTSWWVCSSMLDCPGHWLPYLVIFTIGVSVFTLIGAGIAAALRGLYQITKV